MKGTKIYITSIHIPCLIPIDNGAKSQDVIEGTKDENESTVHNEETHGTSDDIDEKTPIDEVKAPGVFQRVKEEVEAVVEAVQPKK